MSPRPMQDSNPADSLEPFGMRWIPGGTFRMGDDNAYLEEAPAHAVTVSGREHKVFAAAGRDPGR